MRIQNVKLSVFVQLITQYELTLVVLWELEPDFGKFVALILDNFTQNIIQEQVSWLSWQIPRLQKFLNDTD